MLSREDVRNLTIFIRNPTWTLPSYDEHMAGADGANFSCVDATLTIVEAKNNNS